MVSQQLCGFPILPFINDTEENLRGILDYCIEAKVRGIVCFSMGLTLREGESRVLLQKALMNTSLALRRSIRASTAIATRSERQQR